MTKTLESLVGSVFPELLLLSRKKGLSSSLQSPQEWHALMGPAGGLCLPLISHALGPSGQSHCDVTGKQAEARAVQTWSVCLLVSKF